MTEPGCFLSRRGRLAAFTGSERENPQRDHQTETKLHRSNALSSAMNPAMAISVALVNTDGVIRSNVSLGR